MAFHIRPATAGDAPAIAALYAHYVLNTPVTFEIEPPTASEIAHRIAAVQGLNLPWLVAELDAELDGGVLAGYAYAGHYRPRAAYRFTVEDSVYIAPGHHRLGIGRALLSAVIEAARVSGHRQMIAGMGGENSASIALHAALGFTPVGVLTNVGFKFDRWWNVTLMQRAL